MGDATKSILGTAAKVAAIPATGILGLGSSALLAAGALGVKRDIDVTTERGEFAAKDAATKEMEAEADAANRERIAKYYANIDKERANSRLGRNSTLSAGNGILLGGNQGSLLR